MQAAVYQAMEAWASQDNTQISPEPLAALEGSLADVDVFRLLREERVAEQRKERDKETA